MTINLETEIRAIFNENSQWLTVECLSKEIAERIMPNVDQVLKAMVNSGDLIPIHGHPGYARHYGKPELLESVKAAAKALSR